MQQQGHPITGAPVPNQYPRPLPNPPGMPPFFPQLMPGMPPPPFPMPMMPGPHGMPFLPFPLPPGVQFPPPMPGMGMGMMPPLHGLPRPITSVSGPSISSAPVPAAPVQMLVGNPILRGPTSVASVVAISSANNISLFNNINTNCCFINATSDLLNKHIFANAMAGLPLTIFLGNVPLDMEDGKLAKMFESCGKVTKFIRPVDPISLLPTTFAFITYAQAICAYRAFNIFNNFAVSKEQDWKIVVKVGTKEAPIIKSIQETEDEAAASLPPGFSLDDVYNPIKASIESILAPNEKPVDEKTESGEIVTTEPSTNTANEGTVDPLEDTASYYKYLNREAGEVGPEDESSEKLLLSEIEKFRLRQLERDKFLEEQRRQKVKERLIALEAAKKRQAEEQARLKESGGAVKEGKAEGAVEVAQKRKPEVVNYEEMEAKKRRKLQVLQMLSGENQEEEGEEEKKAAGPIKVSAALTRKPAKQAGKTISAVATMDEEDETEKKREMILLEYTEEELKSFADHDRRRFDDDDEEDNKNTKKAARKEEKAASTATSSQSNDNTNNNAVSNEALRKIAEKIPTDRNELLSHAINWSILESQEIVTKFLREWVVKRTKEYLGEEVESLTVFIVAQLKARCQPQELLDELTTILEDDSEAFVLKLWRMLVYYSLKCELEAKSA